ncbi:MAG: methionyl-tRNA formyltransferase [Candidatus Zixiibacteriota bacterium]
MRIIFMGTPEFAIPSLKVIQNSKHQLLAVITQPDKPKGRGKKLTPSPVKEFCLENQLKVLAPKNLKSEDFVSELKALNPDLMVVVAFRILPQGVFSIPPLGTINLHASLLPKYRGAAPINWAIFKGEKKTGLTTFFIEKKVDTGNMILQKGTEIQPEETYGELSQRLSELGAELILETIDQIEKGEVKLLTQDDKEATSAPKITPELCKIDWSKPAIEIKNLIRGLSPAPGAYTSYQGKPLKIFKAQAVNDTPNSEGFGEVISADKNKGLEIKTSKGTLRLLELQPQSKRRMKGEEFLRGYRIKIGDKLE